jgi:malate permease and related proteins
MGEIDLLLTYPTLLAQLLPVISCAAIGFLWGKQGKAFPSEFISQVAISFATPSLVFYTLVTTGMDNTLLLKVGLAAVVSVVFMALIASVLLRLTRLPVLFLLPCATFPNAGNLGLPMAQMSYGDEGMVIAVTFFAIFSFMQHTIGVSFLAWANHKTSSPKQNFPYGVAVVGVSAVLIRYFNIPVPAPILGTTKLVGSLAVPLMLVSLGYALSVLQRSRLNEGTKLGLLRLAVGALGGALVIYLADFPLLTSEVIMLQLLMPVAVVNYIYTDRLTPYGDTAAAAVLVSTGVFAVLSPLIIAWSSFGASLIHRLPH